MNDKSIPPFVTVWATLCVQVIIGLVGWGGYATYWWVTDLGAARIEMRRDIELHGERLMVLEGKALPPRLKVDPAPPVACRTPKCVMCLQDAKAWTGHVRHGEEVIIAGWCSKCDPSTTSGLRGYCGEWTEGMGRQPLFRD